MVFLVDVSIPKYTNTVVTEEKTESATEMINAINDFLCIYFGNPVTSL